MFAVSYLENLTESHLFSLENLSGIERIGVLLLNECTNLEVKCNYLEDSGALGKFMCDSKEMAVAEVLAATSKNRIAFF